MSQRPLGIALLFLVSCVHTVGALEVSGRAAYEMHCPDADLAVQTIARNHYAASGCGQTAVFICRSGACERDSEITPLPDDATVMPDLDDAHRRLDAIREEVLECLTGDGVQLTLVATMEVDGRLGDHDYTHRAATINERCVRHAFRQVSDAHRTYAHPIYLHHTFSAQPWTPPQPAAPSANAPATNVETTPSETAPSEPPPVEPVDDPVPSGEVPAPAI